MTTTTDLDKLLAKALLQIERERRGRGYADRDPESLPMTETEQLLAKLMRGTVTLDQLEAALR